MDINLGGCRVVFKLSDFLERRYSQYKLYSHFKHAWATGDIICGQAQGLTKAPYPLLPLQEPGGGGGHIAPLHPPHPTPLPGQPTLPLQEPQAYLFPSSSSSTSGGG